MEKGKEEIEEEEEEEAPPLPLLPQQGLYLGRSRSSVVRLQSPKVSPRSHSEEPLICHLTHYTLAMDSPLARMLLMTWQVEGPKNFSHEDVRAMNEALKVGRRYIDISHELGMRLRMVQWNE